MNTQESPANQRRIEQLALTAHPEGGYFRRLYTAPWQGSPQANQPPRAWASSIHYLLTDAQPRGHLHRNRSDILHYWQHGGVLRYTLLYPDGTCQQVLLGPDLTQQQLTLLVPAGVWKASELIEGDHGLIAELVTPGFDYADWELADQRLLAHYPEQAEQLRPLLTPAGQVSASPCSD